MNKKKALISCLFLSALFTINVMADEYDDGTFKLTYDSDYFYVDISDGGAISVKAYNMPDDNGGHNTVLGCLSEENTEYYNLGELSSSDLRDFKNTFTHDICTGLFEVDDGVSVVADGYTYLGDKCEYFMVLSDRTECYATIYNYDETVYYTVCRLCNYTSDLNDGFRSAYKSIELSSDHAEEISAGDAKESIEEENSEAKSIPSEAETMGQKNALRSALSYLEYSAFSYTGLIEQLEYEGYSNEDAVYAVDNCGADWNEQAAKSAELYLEYSAFSRDSLIDQLEYEGFTYEQAVYGVESNGY